MDDLTERLRHLAGDTTASYSECLDLIEARIEQLQRELHELGLESLKVVRNWQAAENRIEQLEAELWIEREAHLYSALSDNRISSRDDLKYSLDRARNLYLEQKENPG